MENTLQYTQNWTVIRKVLFRFFFLFFGLQIVPFPINVLPFLNSFFYDYIDEYFWNPIVQLVGRIFLGIDEITVRPNGSGDTTWNWVQLLSIIILSAVACLIWSVLDRKRAKYDRLNYWFIVLLRYYLGYVLLSYGFIKVFPLQFGTLTTYRLFERFGDMSPMGVLWTFMATSTGYQAFSGFCEVLAGALLFFRRTTTLGALISVGVMGNIFALNVFYDVPVKIYSFELMLIGCYLAFEDVRRLLNFFVLNKPTEAQNLNIYSDKKWFRIGRIIVKVLLIGWFAGMMLYDGWSTNQYKDVPKTAIYGPYQVERFEKNGIVSATDTLRWQEVFIDRRGSSDLIFVTNENGLRKRVNFMQDKKSKTLKINDYASTDTTKYRFSYFQADSSSLILRGKIKADTFNVTMKKFPDRKFLLISRGFHWVNEVPFNK
jgi:uncharacterized membrane protein YphA (DoxX/SURF4 family)